MNKFNADNYALIPHFTRCRSLCIKTTEMYAVEPLLEGEVPIMEELDIQVPHFLDGPGEDVQVMLHAPRLRTVRLQKLQFSWTGMSFPSLTSLHICETNVMSPQWGEQLWGVVSTCPLLANLTIAKLKHPSNMPQPRPLPQITPHHFPSLRVLELKEVCASVLRPLVCGLRVAKSQLKTLEIDAIEGEALVDALVSAHNSNGDNHSIMDSLETEKIELEFSLSGLLLRNGSQSNRMFCIKIPHREPWSSILRIGRLAHAVFPTAVVKLRAGNLPYEMETLEAAATFAELEVKYVDDTLRITQHLCDRTSASKRYPNLEIVRFMEEGQPGRKTGYFEATLFPPLVNNLRTLYLLRPEVKFYDNKGIRFEPGLVEWASRSLVTITVQ